MVQVRRAGALKLDTARSKNFLRLAHETRRSCAGLIRRNIEKDLGDFQLAALSDLASLGTTPCLVGEDHTFHECLSSHAHGGHVAMHDAGARLENNV